MRKYTKIPQTAFTKVQPGEYVLKLDTDDMVAVSVIVAVEENTGNPTFAARARAVNADGSSKVDGTGSAIESGFTHTSNSTELAAMGGMQGMQKIVALAVLGEDTGSFLSDTVHQTVKDNASIRINLASAKAAGTVTNLDTFL